MRKGCQGRGLVRKGARDEPTTWPDRSSVTHLRASHRPNFERGEELFMTEPRGRTWTASTPDSGAARRSPRPPFSYDGSVTDPLFRGIVPPGKTDEIRMMGPTPDGLPGE